MKPALILSLLFFVFNQLHSQGLRDYLPEGKFIGTALGNSFLEENSNPEYYKIVEHDFNCIVAENSFKMSHLLPGRPADPFNLNIEDFSNQGLARVDALLLYADINQMKTRGHTLIWHNQAPDWLNSDANNWTNQQIYDFAKSYITVVGTYCSGKIDEWDVVNEAITDDGNNPGFRANAWYSGVDNTQDFLGYCFEVAHEVIPEADLFYNDYNIETSYFAKNTKMLSMVEEMVNQGIPIDGVGLQSHFTNGPNTNDWLYTELEKTIDAVGALGLKCNITELDIRICGGTSESDLQKQAEEYQSIVEIFLRNQHINSLVLWGFTDASSWIPSTFDGCDDALIYDKNLDPKPAYDAISSLLQKEYSGPFEYTPATIPGRVEAENYNYNNFIDNDTENQGGAYREDAVDIASDGSGYVVGWTEDGEQLNYTVQVNYTDSFFVSVSYATGIDDTTSALLQLLMDDVPLGTTFELSGTGSYSTFDLQEQEGIFLMEGMHKLTLNIIRGSVNIDYFDFIRNDCAGVKGGTAFIDDCDQCAGGTTGIEICENRAPFSEINLPGILEIENYDLGGKEDAYYDSTEGNEGNAYRNDDVDVAATGDLEGGYALAYIEQGEWLEYTVNVIDTGFYNVHFRVASDMGGGLFKMLVNGLDVTGNISVDNTGGWESFLNISLQGIQILNEGTNIIRLEFEKGGFNFNHIAFEKTIFRNPFTEITLPGKLEVEDYDVGGEGVAYHDNTSGNTGNSYREDDVDMGGTSDDGGGFVLAWTESGEWTEYTVNISETGNYKLSFRHASGNGGGQIKLYIDGEVLTETVNFGNTGDWNDFETIEVEDVAMDAGEAVIRLVFENGGVNLNYVLFELQEESNAVNDLTKNLKIFPNPFRQEINIQGYEQNMIWDLYSIDGKLIRTGKTQTIDGSNLKKGVYFLKINTQTFKVIKAE